MNENLYFPIESEVYLDSGNVFDAFREIPGLSFE